MVSHFYLYRAWSIYVREGRVFVSSPPVFACPYWQVVQDVAGNCNNWKNIWANSDFCMQVENNFSILFLKLYSVKQITLVSCRDIKKIFFSYRDSDKSLSVVVIVGYFLFVFWNNVFLWMIHCDTLWPSLCRINKYFIPLFIKYSLVCNKCAIHSLQLFIASLTVEGFHSCFYVYFFHMMAKQWWTNCSKQGDKLVATSKYIIFSKH